MFNKNNPLEAPAYVMGENSITLVIEGKAHTIAGNNAQFKAIKEALKNEEYHLLEDLVDKTKAISNFSQGSVNVVDGEVLYNGSTLDNSLTRRLLRMMEEGFNIEPLTNFLDNLMQNPSQTSVNELYSFLENTELPITPDGHFLAYKRVRDDYKDCHSGKIDNSVGQVVSMTRNQVNDNRDETCSYGLHFCSYEYLRSFTGARLMILKINPKDVVSIPSDYNNAKGRCCEYTVHSESLEDFDITRDRLEGSSVYIGVESYEPEFDGSDDDDDDYFLYD